MVDDSYGYSVDFHGITYRVWIGHGGRTIHIYTVLKPFIIRLTMIFAGFLVAVLVMEVVLITVGYSYPVLYIADDHRGWSLRPGTSGKGTQAGAGWISVNSEGLRDREYAKSKPDNTIRIAVLGDSFTEAQQVALEDTYWSVMEDTLTSCHNWIGHNVEVINFGVSAYGTAQELITLRHFVWDYSPDLVLLAFYPENDFQDNYNIGAKARPYFFIREGELILDNSFKERPEYRFKLSRLGRFSYFIVNHSRVLQLAKRTGIIGKLESRAQKFMDLFVNLSDAKIGVQVVEKSTDDRKPMRAVLESNWKRSETTVLHGEVSEEVTAPVGVKGFSMKQSVPHVYIFPHLINNQDGTENGSQRVGKGPSFTGFDSAKALELTNRLISTMNEEVIRNGSRLTVMIIPEDPSYSPGKPNSHLKDRRFEISPLVTTGKRLGIPVLSMDAEFLSHSLDIDESLYIGGHWNEKGHKLAGEMISEAICKSSD